MRKIGHFTLWLGAGFLLYALVSCATMRGAGEDLKNAGHWLPDPYGAVATSLGTVLSLFTVKKVHRHYTKKRDARKAAAATHGK